MVSPGLIKVCITIAHLIASFVDLIVSSDNQRVKRMTINTMNNTWAASTRAEAIPTSNPGPPVIVIHLCLRYRKWR